MSVPANLEASAQARRPVSCLQAVEVVLRETAAVVVVEEAEQAAQLL